MEKRVDLNYYLTDEKLLELQNKSAEELAEEYRWLREKYKNLQNKYKERVTIERAKDIVRDKLTIERFRELRDVDEKLLKVLITKFCTGDEAFQYIQKIASAKNLRLDEVARMVIAVKEMM